MLAMLAASEAQALVSAPVRVLAGGNAAWARAGYALVPGDSNMADERIDAWPKP